jgi:carbonic anhydrase/acetyltransferase-like protein (isoleucine patch superfamily)
LVTEGKTFPSGSLIIGSPAKAVRELSPDVIAALQQSAAGYADRQRRFAKQLRRID